MNTTEPTAGLEPITDDSPDVDQATEPDEPTDTTKAGREAAKYRRQLRATETERDTLMALVESLRRTEVERIVEKSTAQIKPEALWASGTNLSDLLTEDGAIDTERVNAAAMTAAEKFGVPLPKAPSSAGQGNVGGPVNGSGSDGMTWEKALSGR